MTRPTPSGSTPPAPERPDTEDAYLRCIKCGWSYPLVNTPADEPCDMCGGYLAYAIGEWRDEQ